MSVSDFDRSLDEGPRLFGGESRWLVERGRRPNAPRLSERVTFEMFIAIELALIVLAGIIARQIYLIHYLGSDAEIINYLPPLMAIAGVTFIVFRERGLYRRFALRNAPASFVRSAASLIISFSIVIVLGYLMGIADYYSRMWMLLWLIGSICLVLPARGICAGVLRRWAADGRFSRRVALIGYANSTAAMRHALDTEGDINDVILEIDAKDLIQDINKIDSAPASAQRAAQNGENISPLGRLVAQGQENSIDRVLVALPGFKQEDLSRLLEHLSVLAASISLVQPDLAPAVPVRDVHQVGRMTFLDVQRRPIADHGVLLKSIEDYVLGAIATVLFLPVMSMCALAIRLEDGGPVFFRQRRHGYDHNVISVWKFRTMRVAEDGDTIKQATRGDDRITRVGRFLRKTSLDELPQLINVMRGEMSLVGPRPHAIAHNVMYERMLTRYANRHRVKPGITGWAQINGFRGPTEDPDLMRKRVELDLYYIENWSIWLDLKILIATPFLGFVSRNAL